MFKIEKSSYWSWSKAYTAAVSLYTKPVTNVHLNSVTGCCDLRWTSGSRWSSRIMWYSWREMYRMRKQAMQLRLWWTVYSHPQNVKVVWRTTLISLISKNKWVNINPEVYKWFDLTTLHIWFYWFYYVYWDWDPCYTQRCYL